MRIIAWLWIAELAPQEELGEEYRNDFSDVGRSAKGAKLVIGPLLLKHITGLCDGELVLEIAENPFILVFCVFISEIIIENVILFEQRYVKK